MQQEGGRQSGSLDMDGDMEEDLGEQHGDAKPVHELKGADCECGGDEDHG